MDAVLGMSRCTVVSSSGMNIRLISWCRWIYDFGWSLLLSELIRLFLSVMRTSMFWSWDHKALQPHSATFVFGDKVEFVIWSCFSECNFFLLIGNQDFYAYFVFVDQAAYYCLFVCLFTNFTKILSEAVCFWFVFASSVYVFWSDSHIHLGCYFAHQPRRTFFEEHCEVLGNRPVHILPLFQLNSSAQSFQPPVIPHFRLICLSVRQGRIFQKIWLPSFTQKPVVLRKTGKNRHEFWV